MARKPSTTCRRGHAKPLGGDCPECNRLRCAAHWKAERKLYLEKQAAYRDANRREIRTRNLEYQRTHRREINAQNRARRAARFKPLVAKLCRLGHLFARGTKGGCPECIVLRSRCREAHRPGFGAMAARCTADGRKVCRNGHVHDERKCRECFNAYLRAWHVRHPDRESHYAQRRRARKREAFGAHSPAEWAAVLAFYRHRCAACGKKPKRLEKDHVIPLADGGSDMAMNLQPLCVRCNRSKGARVKSGAQYALFDRPEVVEQHG